MAGYICSRCDGSAKTELVKEEMPVYGKIVRYLKCGYCGNEWVSTIYPSTHIMESGCFDHLLKKKQ